jgi:hypothetical protein
MIEFDAPSGRIQVEECDIGAIEYRDRPIAETPPNLSLRDRYPVRSVL